MCRPRASFTAIFLALVIAGLCRAAVTGVAQPASRALPEGVRHPATNPSDAREGRARTLAVLGSDPVGQEGRRLRDVPSPRLRLRREPRPLDRRQRRRALAPSRQFAAGQHDSIRQAEQPDDPERRVQRHRCVGPLRSRRRRRCSGTSACVSLEAQALEPIKSFEEMRGDAYSEAEALDAVVGRLASIAEYRALFNRAFGGARPVTAANLGKALAAFERTLVANNSPFDRYMRGDLTAMTSAQISGMERFDRVGARIVTADRCSRTSSRTCSACPTMPSWPVRRRRRQLVRLPHAVAAQPSPPRPTCTTAPSTLPEVLRFYRTGAAAAAESQRSTGPARSVARGR